MKVTSETKATTPDFYDLLEQAVNQPGKLAGAYKFFRQYSLTNRWLAACQLRSSGRPLQPINTFKGWLAVNRVVKKGQKSAVALVMPVPIKVKKEDEDGSEKESLRFTKFMLRNYWFALDQTEADGTADPEFQLDQAEDTSEWKLSAAMDFLEIKEVEFLFKGVGDVRRLGDAVGRNISVSPLETHAVLGRVRQIAAVLLGHSSDNPARSVPTSASLRLLEAEATTYLVAATLGLPGSEECRGLIQANLKEDEASRIPDRSASRAFSVADKILNAGYA